MQPRPVPWYDAPYYTVCSAPDRRVPRVGAPLHTDDTTLRHHALLVEEPSHGEYPHPQ